MEFPILWAEDQPNDVQLLRHVCGQSGLGAPIRVVPNGKEALEYLQNKGRFSDSNANPFPCMLLTDIKMSYVDGMELLQKILNCRWSLPCFVLSSSVFNEEQQRALELGALVFWTKPNRIEGWRRWAEELRMLWVPLCLHHRLKIDDAIRAFQNLRQEHD